MTPHEYLIVSARTRSRSPSPCFLSPHLSSSSPPPHVRSSKPRCKPKSSKHRKHKPKTKTVYYIDASPAQDYSVVHHAFILGPAPPHAQQQPLLFWQPDAGPSAGPSAVLRQGWRSRDAITQVPAAPEQLPVPPAAPTPEPSHCLPAGIAEYAAPRTARARGAALCADPHRHHTRSAAAAPPPSRRASTAPSFRNPFAAAPLTHSLAPPSPSPSQAPGAQARRSVPGERRASEGPWRGAGLDGAEIQGRARSASVGEAGRGHYPAGYAGRRASAYASSSSDESAADGARRHTVNYIDAAEYRRQWHERRRRKEQEQQEQQQVEAQNRAPAWLGGCVWGEGEDGAEHGCEWGWGTAEEAEWVVVDDGRRVREYGYY